MNSEKYITSEIETPAFICDLDIINKTLYFHKEIAEKSGCKILFSLKSFTIIEILKYIQKKLDGFSVSSLFEAKLAKKILTNNQYIHFTTPGIRKDEIEEISQISSHLIFNSLSQYEQYKSLINANTQIGFRINPKFSANIDTRYNPCCLNSKLGIPIKDFVNFIKEKSITNFTGIHFHTNCDSTDFSFLYDTFYLLEKNMKDIFNKIKWINLGGGYLYEGNPNLDIFYNLIKEIKKKYNIEVFIEPGSSIIRNSCFLIANIIDLFEGDNKKIAILDTTINHIPEVFEYNYRLKIHNESFNGNNEYILCGSSCLAGDKFGSYKFDNPLKIGDKIIFENIGSYSIVKANMFNGINLPDFYQYDKINGLNLIKKFNYEDFIEKYE